METDIRGFDLERELTCSICTEVLYQPLTLLDCLHTFCGSCLKEWFSFQLNAYRTAPNSLPAGATPYTCPSCRAPVRDTKHDAKVTTLLEMFLAVNTDKGKTDEEKAELSKKYVPRENVLPKVEEREKTLRERRAEDADRRLMNEVRDMSLREVGVESSEARRERRRRENALRQPRSRDTSRDGRQADAERRRRHEEHDHRHRRPEVSSRDSEEERRRQRHAEWPAREESARTAVREIEHQPSLRSLISSSDVDSRDMEEEILRQIREEGLLDGIDLENIDVSQEDQISERIAEAFRRRQNERARQEESRRSDTSRRRRAASSSAPHSRETSGDEAVRPSSRRRRAHSRTPSGNSQSAEISRPPQSMSAMQAAHLEVQSGDESRRRRRRTTSGSRSATDPIRAAQPEARPAARSQTDLSERTNSLQSHTSRPSVSNGARSNTDPSLSQTSQSSATDQRSRHTRTSPTTSPRMLSTAQMEDHLPRERKIRSGPPAEILVTPATSSLIPAPLSPHDPARTMSLSDRANALASGSRPSSSSSTMSRNRPQFFNEPNLTCERCSKPHIEYDLHYNCSICAGGNYNICLSCYRNGAGCLHWFGFGQTAWMRWEMKNQMGDGDLEKPHMLTPSRYLPPRSTAGGADGRKTLTTDDPQKRLQSGTFCANCLAWTNECYWRCDSCNEGDWGFCNTCVNQGKSCTHSLLPLTYKPVEVTGPPLSPTHDQPTPATASILTGPGVIDIGPFKPLTFSTKCDICRYPIQPSQTRYHCYSCTSKVPGTLPGDYDVCTTCYNKLISSRRISPENGSSGWRRCLQGHRMVVVGFEDSHGGQRRVLVHDLVGGRGLRERPASSPEYAGQDLQIWSWGDGVHVRGDDTHRRLVTSDVMKTAPAPTASLNPSSNPNAITTSQTQTPAHESSTTTNHSPTTSTIFPPNGGVGMTAVVTWRWYPAADADDELLFPKGAEVRECKDVNGDWYHGSYMGKTGLFPSNYVRVL